MKPKNLRKIKESSFFKSSTKLVIKEDLEHLKKRSEELEKEVEKKIKDMYIDEFFQLYELVLGN